MHYLTSNQVRFNPASAYISKPIDRSWIISKVCENPPPRNTHYATVVNGMHTSRSDPDPHLTVDYYDNRDRHITRKHISDDRQDRSQRIGLARGIHERKTGGAMPPIPKASGRNSASLSRAGHSGAPQWQRNGRDPASAPISGYGPSGGPVVSLPAGVATGNTAAWPTTGESSKVAQAPKAFGWGAFKWGGH